MIMIPQRSQAQEIAPARIRQDLYDLYAEFVAVFRTAAEKLKSGAHTVAFPIGSFPPHLPFEAAAPPLLQTLLGAGAERNEARSAGNVTRKGL